MQSPRRQRQNSSGHTRRGAIVVIVMVAILFSTAIGASLLKQVLAERTLVSMQQCRLQADWLAESGLERAVASLNADPAYAGETWAPESLPTSPTTNYEVVILVEPDDSAQRRRRVTVTARLKGERFQEASTSKILLIDLNTPAESGT